MRLQFVAARGRAAKSTAWRSRGLPESRSTSLGDGFLDHLLAQPAGRAHYLDDVAQAHDELAVLFLLESQAFEASRSGDVFMLREGVDVGARLAELMSRGRQLTQPVVLQQPVDPGRNAAGGRQGAAGRDRRCERQGRVVRRAPPQRAPPAPRAGMFYPRDPHHFEQLLEKLFHGRETGLDAKGIVSPHAGYPYSGEVAASAYNAIPATFSGTFIVIGPSHRGYQTCISRIPWETPLGIIDVDPELGSAIDLEADEISHRDEHSLEVQMPFIKYRFPRARILPILMGDQELVAAEMLATKILDAVRQTKRDDVRFDCIK